MLALIFVGDRKTAALSLQRYGLFGLPISSDGVYLHGCLRGQSRRFTQLLMKWVGRSCWGCLGISVLDLHGDFTR